MGYKFGVLAQFQKAVDACQVSRGAGKGAINLMEGLERAVATLLEVRETSKKVAIVGNGGSAAIASHQVVDLWRNGGLRAMAFNDPALLTCIANDFGYPNVFSKPIDMFCDPGDCLIAISSSGNSPNILQAVDKAREKGCAIIGFSGFRPSNHLRLKGDLNFYVPSQSYGVVGAAHMLIVHTIVDEFIRRTKEEVLPEGASFEKSIFRAHQS